MVSKSPRSASSRGVSNGRILLWSVLLLISIVLAVFILFHVAGQNANEEQYSLRADEQQVLSQRIAKTALLAGRGDETAFAQLRRSRERFETVLLELKKGAGSMSPSPQAAQQELKLVEASWGGLRKLTDDILRNKESVVALREAADVIYAQAPALTDASDRLAKSMVAETLSQEQIFQASAQMMLAQRMGGNAARILGASPQVAPAVDQLSRDVDQFGQTLKLLRADLSGMPVIVRQIKSVEAAYAGIVDKMQAILSSVAKVLPALESANSLSSASNKVDEAAQKLAALYRSGAGRISVAGIKAGPLMLALLTAAAVLFLILLVVQLLIDARRREEFSKAQNESNQKAILRLLDEMGDLADGDLTVTATVTEDITGAIADSINYAIEALRRLVTTINETSERVSSSAQESRATAMHLAEASEHQADQISDAAGWVKTMTEAIDQMSSHASESAEVAQGSTETAGKGADTVRRSIEGMDGIREQIQETSKRIKRLGESSQEIGDIVELIDDIADQTNILALNAAMQAAMAGEAGRGFAVVADEVQRLAERSSNATKQIEALVKTIQADTNEAVRSMETSTTGVVRGAKLAEDAGDALMEIENVSNYIAEITRKIAVSAEKQSSEAGKISNTMSVIQEITTQTSEGTGQTASSIGTLADLATELRRSVAGFRLPE